MDQALNQKVGVTLKGTPTRSLAHRLFSSVVRYWLLLSCFALWQLVSSQSDQLQISLPPPTDVFIAVYELLKKGTLQADILVSLRRVGISMLAAIAIGYPLGLVLGASKSIAWSVEPIVNFLRPIPPLAWIPFSILWFGVSDTQNEFIIFVAAVFPIILNTIEGVRDVDKQLLRAARTLGASRNALVFTVLIPAALPQMFVGLRVGIGIAWMALVAAELVAATSGLGYLINQGRFLFRSDYVLVGMVAIGLIGLLLDGSIRFLQSLLMPWLRARRQ